MEEFRIRHRRACRNAGLTTQTKHELNGAVIPFEAHRSFMTCLFRKCLMTHFLDHIVDTPEIDIIDAIGGHDVDCVA